MVTVLLSDNRKSNIKFVAISYPLESYVLVNCCLCNTDVLSLFATNTLPQTPHRAGALCTGYALFYSFIGDLLLTKFILFASLLK